MITDPYIRQMIGRDLTAVLSIDEQSFESLPWTEEDFDRHRKMYGATRYVAEVVSMDGNREEDFIVGFMVITETKKAIRIKRLAVQDGERRRGVGKLLIGRAKGLSADHGVPIEAELDEDNIDGCGFMAAMGFASKLIRTLGDGPDLIRFTLAPMQIERSQVVVQ